MWKDLAWILLMLLLVVPSYIEQFKRKKRRKSTYVYRGPQDTSANDGSPSNQTPDPDDAAGPGETIPAAEEVRGEPRPAQATIEKPDREAEASDDLPVKASAEPVETPPAKPEVRAEEEQKPPSPARGKDITNETVIRITSSDGVRYCSRSYSNLSSNNEAEFVRWMMREGFSVPYMYAVEDHDLGDQEWDHGSVMDGNADEIIDLIKGIYGKWRMDAEYRGTKVVIQKEYPSIMHDIRFRYPEAAESSIMPALGRFKLSFCYPSVRTFEEDRDVKAEPAPKPVPKPVTKPETKPAPKSAPKPVAKPAPKPVGASGRVSPPVTADQRAPVKPDRKHIMKACFIPGSAANDAIVACVQRYAREGRQMVFVANKRRPWENWLVPLNSLEAFCRDMAKLGCPVLLKLTAPNLGSYWLDPVANTFYRSGKGEALVRVEQSEMPICCCAVEPDTLCLFGTGSFTSFEHYAPENSGYPTFPWQINGLEWDFYATILCFSKGVDAGVNWTPRHGYDVCDASGQSFFEAVVTPVESREPLPDTDEITRRLRAAAPKSEPGIAFHEPDFPSGDHYRLFTVSHKHVGIYEAYVVETQYVNVKIDLKTGGLYLETTYRYDAPPGKYGQPDTKEAISFDKMEALIPCAEDQNAAFFKGMNAENWRDYVGRDYRADIIDKRLGPPTQVDPSSLLQSPKAIDAFYLFDHKLFYFRRIVHDWRLFMFVTYKGSKIDFTVDNYAARFAAEGEGAVEALKRAANANESWYDRTLTPLEVRYFLSQLQTEGLYDADRGESMPAIQACYDYPRSDVGLKKYLANFQTWYLLDGKRYYLQDYPTENRCRRSIKYDSVLSGICHSTIRGCVLASVKPAPQSASARQKPEPAEGGMAAKPDARPKEKPAPEKPAPAPEKRQKNRRADQKAAPKHPPQPKREASPRMLSGDAAIRAVASRMKSTIIPIETLFCIRGEGDTFNRQNCVFYHPDFVQNENAWMDMKSAWRRSNFSCVVMTYQSEEWAKDVSKRLNERLRQHRITFLKPVEIADWVIPEPIDFEQGRTIARWYAPLEKKRYCSVIKWEGYNHDGSEDYYSLMLYED